MKTTSKISCFFTFKKQILIVFLSVFSLSSIGQTLTSTSTVFSGSWNTPSNWTNGLPYNVNYDASISHAMTVGSHISISSNSVYTVTSTGSIIDSAGGIDVNINIDQQNNGGFLDVDGKVEIQGTLTIQHSGTLIVRSNDTLIVGDAHFQHNASIEVEEFGVMIVNGDLEMKQMNTTILDGQLFVNGNITAQQNSTITGSGKIQATGTTDLSGSATFFGSTSPCSPGPCEYGTGAGLPVKLVEFNANHLNNGKVEVNWVTETELNNDYFLLEKSYDGLSFSEVAIVPGNGTYTQRSEYSLLDNASNKTIYYRLSQVDYNGERKIYNPIALSPSLENRHSNFSISPNPVRTHERISIDFSNSSLENTTIEIRDISGKLMQTKKLNQFPASIQLNENLNNGIYLINIITASGIHTEKLIISK